MLIHSVSAHETVFSHARQPRVRLEPCAIAFDGQQLFSVQRDLDISRRKLLSCFRIRSLTRSVPSGAILWIKASGCQAEFPHDISQVRSGVHQP